MQQVDYQYSRVQPLPTVHLVMEEMLDFTKFIRKLLPWIRECGACKFIPPPEWGNYGKTMEWYKKKMDWSTYKISHPIHQHVSGRAGSYQLQLLEQPDMTVADFKKLADKGWETYVKSKESYFKNFDNGKMSEDDMIEADFWKSVAFGVPMYGSDVDIEGSLFEEGVPWDLDNLPTFLSKAGIRIPGVTNSYLYFGMWKSMFAWHAEDQNLFSMSYNHFGAPKKWYVIPPKYRHDFEQVAKQTFPHLHKKCPSFLQHKLTMIAPKTLLKKKKFPIYTAVQQPGEFVMTMPAAFHAGFNYGFNCAEAVNFATPEWVPMGREYVRCLCTHDRVFMDMDFFEKLANESDDQKSDSASQPEDESKQPKLTESSESITTPTNLNPMSTDTLFSMATTPTSISIDMIGVDTPATTTTALGKRDRDDTLSEEPSLKKFKPVS